MRSRQSNASFSIQQAGCGRVDRRMGRRQDALLERSCGPQPPGQEARLRGDVLKRSQVLSIRNIRILVKARNYIEEVSHILGDDAEPEYLRATLASLLLFSCMKFSSQNPDSLTFEILAKHSEWENRFLKAAAEGGGKDVPTPSLAKDLLQHMGAAINTSEQVFGERGECLIPRVAETLEILAMAVARARPARCPSRNPGRTLESTD